MEPSNLDYDDYDDACLYDDAPNANRMMRSNGDMLDWPQPNYFYANEPPLKAVTVKDAGVNEINYPEISVAGYNCMAVDREDESYEPPTSTETPTNPTTTTTTTPTTTTMTTPSTTTAKIVESTNPPKSEDDPGLVEDISKDARKLQQMIQHLYIAQARVQLEASEIKKAQTVAAAAHRQLGEASTKVQASAATLHAAQQEMASAAIRAQTAELQLAAHDQLLFAARQDVDALSSQMVGLQAAVGIKSPKSSFDVNGLMERLRQPLPPSERPTAVPALVPMPKIDRKSVRVNQGAEAMSCATGERTHASSGMACHPKGGEINSDSQIVCVPITSGLGKSSSGITHFDSNRGRDERRRIHDNMTSKANLQDALGQEQIDDTSVPPMALQNFAVRKRFNLPQQTTEKGYKRYDSRSERSSFLTRQKDNREKDEAMELEPSAALENSPTSITEYDNGQSGKYFDEYPQESGDKKEASSRLDSEKDVSVDFVRVRQPRGKTSRFQVDIANDDNDYDEVLTTSRSSYSYPGSNSRGFGGGSAKKSKHKSRKFNHYDDNYYY